MKEWILTFLGASISEIRQILNLTQEELAKMMGVSRPTILKIEQYPEKMTKSLAFALFGSTAIEMKKRLKSLAAINPSEYKDIEKIGVLVENLKSSSSLSVASMRLAAAKGLGTLIPRISSIVLTGLKNGWESINDTTINRLKENAQ